MSDVRDQLIDYFLGFGGGDAMASMKMADAILERFDVQPKPVVSEQDLDIMVTALLNAQDKDQIRLNFIKQIEMAGLTIVRIEEGE